MDSTIRELHIPAQMQNLARVAEFVEGCCESWRFHPDTAFQIQLAIDEAVTNVIEHAYEEEGGELQLRCWLSGADFYVEVRDHGHRFNPDEVPAPILKGSLNERDAGGLGMHFMRQMMDEVRYEFSEEGNLLVMIKRHVLP